MAEITGKSVVDNGGFIKYTWAGLGNGDTGNPFGARLFADRSVQVVGTFGSGGQMNLEGSNDGGTSWSTLTDPQGNALEMTDTTIEAILEYTELIRPNVTAGDGSTDLTIHIVARKPV